MLVWPALTASDVGSTVQPADNARGEDEQRPAQRCSGQRTQKSENVPVDGGVDTGPVIAQVAVPVLDDDDDSTLHERIKDAERAMLVDTVGRMLRDGYRVTGRKVTVP